MKKFLLLLGLSGILASSASLGCGDSTANKGEKGGDGRGAIPTGNGGDQRRQTATPPLAEARTASPMKTREEEEAYQKVLKELPDILRRLKDKNGQVRLLAADQLTHVEPLPKAAVPNLIEALDDKGDPLSPVVRSFAVQALGNCGADAKHVVPALTQTMMNDSATSIHAETSLKKIGKAGIAGLIKGLEHQDKGIRGIVASDIGSFRAEAMAALPSLLNAVKKEPDEEVRVMMAGAIVEISPTNETGMSVLIECLDPGRAGNTNLIAVAILDELGPQAQAAVPALERMATRGDENGAAEALAALKKIKGGKGN